MHRPGTPALALNSRVLLWGFGDSGWPSKWWGLSLHHTGPASLPQAGQGSPRVARSDPSSFPLQLSARIQGPTAWLTPQRGRGSPCLQAGVCCLFLSQHLPGGQAEGVQGARPQLFLVPSAPKLL